jgi:hypothetical protein
MDDLQQSGRLRDFNLMIRASFDQPQSQHGIAAPRLAPIMGGAYNHRERF